MSKPENSTTEISKTMLGGLVAALIVLLMLVSFLLGRQTSTPVAVNVPPAPPVAPAQEHPVPTRTLASEPPPTLPPAPAPAQPPAPPSAPAQPAPPPVSQPAPPAPVPVASTPAETVTSRPAPPARPAKPAPSAPSEPTNNKDREAIAIYLREVDSATQGSPDAKDGNAMANEIIQQAMKGDSSGFDTLLASSRKTEQALLNIKPPLACKSHHEGMVRQITRSIQLLNKVKGAVASNDLNSLSALAGQGQAMQREAEEFRKADEKLRSLAR